MIKKTFVFTSFMVVAVQAAVALPTLLITYQDPQKICNPMGMRLLFASIVEPNNRNVYYDTHQRIAPGETFSIEHIPANHQYTHASISSVTEADCPGRQAFMLGTCSNLDAALNNEHAQQIMVTVNNMGPPLGYKLDCQVM